MSSRPYDQYCAVARALEVVGDRWTLLIVRELLTGPKRHTDLRHGLPGIATNLLSDRLRELHARGVIRRRVLAPPAASSVYELTERGEELRGVVHAVARWGTPLLAQRRPGDAYRLSWLLLTLEERFDAEAAGDERLAIAFRIGDEALAVTVAEGRVRSRQPPPEDPDVVVEGELGTFLAWGTGRLPDDQALREGLKVTGGAATLARLRRLFPIPQAGSGRDPPS